METLMATDRELKSRASRTALRLIALLVLVAAPAVLLAQDEVTIDEAKDHVGEEVTVCGDVTHAVFVEVERRQPTYLNFGAPWPDHTFGVMIRGRHRGRFPEPPEALYADKTICVTGEIVLSEGVPQITVNRPAQIRIRATESDG
jgi:hypothetical protein